MGVLDGKKILVTGVLTDASLAYDAARLAIDEGAEVVLTSFGRAMRLTERTARKLPVTPDVVELDITDPEHVASVSDDLASRWGQVDGALHSIGFAPETTLGGNFMSAGWDDVSIALHVSAYSLKALADVVRPHMTKGGSIVGLTFDGSVAWPAYDWMGVAKAALESTSRYLARDLGPSGIRVNLVSAGPIRTIASRSIEGFDAFEDAWTSRAPLGWNVQSQAPVARAIVALLSDWFDATTGEIIHVDGGYHALGA